MIMVRYPNYSSYNCYTDNVLSDTVSTSSEQDEVGDDLDEQSDGAEPEELTDIHSVGDAVSNDNDLEGHGDEPTGDEALGSDAGEEYEDNIDLGAEDGEDEYARDEYAQLGFGRL